MLKKEINTEWFKDWFDSDYYHILYQDRNDDEATLFITNIIRFLNITPKQHVLDLACGKGRHALILNQFDLNVVGVDLSHNSILEANKNSNSTLAFFVHDMRDKLSFSNLDVIFNLFTSFGYFDDTNDNIKVLKSVFDALKSDGYFVIDFMNAKKVIENLTPNEVKICSNINFKIERWHDDKHIYKKIQFDVEVDEGNNVKREENIFLERVQILFLSDFERLLNKSGFYIENKFGNYHLDSFDENNSDRLILIIRKHE
jgi:SAM-dependent methyltransferase